MRHAQQLGAAVTRREVDEKAWTLAIASQGMDVAIFSPFTGVTSARRPSMHALNPVSSICEKV